MGIKEIKHFDNFEKLQKYLKTTTDRIKDIKIIANTSGHSRIDQVVNSSARQHMYDTFRDRIDHVTGLELHTSVEYFVLIKGVKRDKSA
jgi:hypothetical protein